VTMQAEIATLLDGRDRFDPEILTPKLEAYVDEQVSKNSYDLEANLALLRFYQYNPATAKIPIVCKILTKALMRMPETDFMLCLYLLPVAVQKDAKIDALKSLWDKLETCEFKIFWEEYGKMAGDLTVPKDQIEAGVRKFVVGVVGMTYQSVAKSELEAMLKGANVETVCKEQGWKVAGSDIIIPVGEYNHASSKDMSNPVTFEKDIAPIVVASSGL